MLTQLDRYWYRRNRFVNLKQIILEPLQIEIRKILMKSEMFSPLSFEITIIMNGNDTISKRGVTYRGSLDIYICEH